MGIKQVEETLNLCIQISIVLNCKRSEVRTLFRAVSQTIHLVEHDLESSLLLLIGLDILHRLLKRCDEGSAFLLWSTPCNIGEQFQDLLRDI